MNTQFKQTYSNLQRSDWSNNVIFIKNLNNKNDSTFSSSAPRDTALDILRIIACLMVIGSHSPMPRTDANGIFLSTLSYATVPSIGLFFMVSGALLLPVRTNTVSFLKKRLGKILIPTLLWSIFYICCDAIISEENTDWLRTICSIPFSAQGNPVLWFMYALAGIYLIAPILSKWLVSANRKEIQIYLGLWGISLCYPLLSTFINPDRGNTGILYYFTGYAGYFLLGYYMKQYHDSFCWKIMLPALSIAVLSPVICKLNRLEINFYDLFWNLSVFVAIQCICWYKAIRKLSHRGGERTDSQYDCQELHCRYFQLDIRYIFHSHLHHEIYSLAL